MLVRMAAIIMPGGDLVQFADATMASAQWRSPCTPRCRDEIGGWQRVAVAGVAHRDASSMRWYRIPRPSPARR